MDHEIGLKALWLTQQEADWVLDGFKTSNPLTRSLALKAAGLVLEFAADDAKAEAADLLADQPHPLALVTD